MGEENMGKLVPGSHEWDEIQETDLPKTEIIDETKIVSQNVSARYRGSVRVSMNKYETDKDHAEWRRKILNTPLP